jgi:hypothetical protein
VLRSFEPAFAGRVPPRVLRLGSGLSRHTRKIGSHFVGVGSKPGCGNTCCTGILRALAFRLVDPDSAHPAEGTACTCLGFHPQAASGLSIPTGQTDSLPP